MTTVRAVSENGIWAPNPPSVRNAKGFDTFYGLWPAIALISMILKPVIRMATCNNTSTTGGNCLSTVTSPMNWLLRHSSLLRRASSPLCCICPLPLPHSPNEATEEDLARFEGQPRQKYAAMMYALDRGVGKIVDELKAAGKFDNTIIFFLSDNGGSTTNQSSNLPLRKGSREISSKVDNGFRFLSFGAIVSSGTNVSPG